MALIELISEKVVKVPLVSKDKPSVLRELIHILQEAGKIDAGQEEAAFEKIMKRENECSTGLENGIAVPHSKCPQVKSLTIAIGVSPEGIDFEALDGNPSQLFFLILAPPDQSGPHLQALSEIAKITRSQALLRLIKSAQSAAEVVELFTED